MTICKKCGGTGSDAESWDDTCDACHGLGEEISEDVKRALEHACHHPGCTNYCMNGSSRWCEHHIYREPSPLRSDAAEIKLRLEELLHPS